MKNYISESIEKDNEQEFTIWSSSDFAESGEQIPLVKIKLGSEGEPYAEALSDDAFDTESYKIASNSLKATVGRPLKDRLLRIDKSLNHSDPFFSTELQRDNIRATRGNTVPKAEITDVPGDTLPTTDEDKEARREKIKKDVSKFSPTGLRALASQVLVTNRDDLKAASGSKDATEADLTHLFKKMTGVDYYTDEVVDKEQYSTVLDLLGKPTDIYDKDYESPEENNYIQGLKDLTETLIEKIKVKQNPNYQQDGIAKVNTSSFLNKLKKETNEGDIVSLYSGLTGVDYYTDKITNPDAYASVLADLGIDNYEEPKDNTFIQDLKNKTEDIIEKAILAEDPDFYKR